jgi:Lon protease-like protein
MFPLGTVLFPHALLPLHVFEPRYRAMTRDVLAGDHEFGVVLIERGSEVGGGDVRFEVGTLAHVVQASELPDGRFALAVVGVERFRVEQWLPDEPYPRAEIAEFTGPAGTTRADDTAALVDPLVAGVQELHALAARLQGIAEPHTISVSPDPEQASFELAALASLGPLDAQRVLELPDTGARLRALGLLVPEAVALLRARIAEEGESG